MPEVVSLCIANIPDGGIVNYGRNITNGKVQCHHLAKSQKLRMRLHRPVLRCLNMCSIIYFLIYKIGMYASKYMFCTSKHTDDESHIILECSRTSYIWNTFIDNFFL